MISNKLYKSGISTWIKVRIILGDINICIHANTSWSQWHTILPQRIHQTNGISPHIRKLIQPTPKPNRILADEAAGLGIIIPCAVVVQPCAIILSSGVLVSVVACRAALCGVAVGFVAVLGVDCACGVGERQCGAECVGDVVVALACCGAGEEFIHPAAEEVGGDGAACLFLYGVDAVVEVAGLAAVDGFAGAPVVGVVLEAGDAATADLG